MSRLTDALLYAVGPSNIELDSSVFRIATNTDGTYVVSYRNRFGAESSKTFDKIIVTVPAPVAAGWEFPRGNLTEYPKTNTECFRLFSESHTRLKSNQI